KEGLFLPIGGATTLEKMASQQQAEYLFMTLLDRFTKQGRNLSEKSNANNYAPAMFAREKEAQERSIRKTNFEAAMRNLFASDKIKVEAYGASSRGWSKLVAK